MKPGDRAPDFSLPDVDGRTVALAEVAAPVVVIVFSCNHCPYVQAYEDRLVAFQNDYGAKGAQLLAINSNDDSAYPEDGPAAMKARAREKGFTFPYLRDETQDVARAYGATHTPQLFVLDRNRRLAYTGKIDDNWQRPAAVTRHFLREAVERLLAGGTPAEPVTHAIGCTIKWK